MWTCPGWSVWLNKGSAVKEKQNFLDLWLGRASEHFFCQPFGEILYYLTQNLIYSHSNTIFLHDTQSCQMYLVLQLKTVRYLPSITLLCHYICYCIILHNIFCFIVPVLLPSEWQSAVCVCLCFYVCIVCQLEKLRNPSTSHHEPIDQSCILCQPHCLISQLHVETWVFSEIMGEARGLLTNDNIYILQFFVTMQSPEMSVYSQVNYQQTNSEAVKRYDIYEPHVLQDLKQLASTQMWNSTDLKKKKAKLAWTCLWTLSIR